MESHYCFGCGKLRELDFQTKFCTDCMFFASVGPQAIRDEVIRLRAREKELLAQIAELKQE